jgi:hydroxysqualene synthase
VGVDHYENFPVATWLCPPALRPAVAAIYWFARTADDIADEGDAPAGQRLDDLAHFEHQLPAHLLHDLLSAFTQDVRNPAYADRPALLDYCRRSANPVGRLLLHLYGMGSDQDLQRSDAICTALQLINFWQDLGTDLRRGRNYLPASDVASHGLDRLRINEAAQRSARRALVRSLCAWASQLMRQGAPLALSMPGRAGWELRLVVQGGMRILEKIEKIDHDTIHNRPTVQRRDAPLLLWRAMRMSAETTP